MSRYHSKEGCWQTAKQKTPEEEVQEIREQKTEESPSAKGEGGVEDGGHDGHQGAPGPASSGRTGEGDARLSIVTQGIIFLFLVAWVSGIVVGKPTGASFPLLLPKSSHHRAAHRRPLGGLEHTHAQLRIL